MRHGAESRARCVPVFRLQLEIVPILYVLCLLLAACGSGTSASTEAKGPEAQAGAKRILSDAAGSSLGGTGIPGGGFVAAGVAGHDGRISSLGVVFNAEGTPTSTFHLPGQLAISTSVVVGNEFFAVGTHCDDAPHINDIGDIECHPGGELGYVVDLKSGKVKSLSLPLPGGRDTAVPGSWKLYRLGTRAMLVANRSGPKDATPQSEADLTPQGFVAWVRNGGDWSSIEPPEQLVCQAGDAVVEDATAANSSSTASNGDAASPNGHVVPTIRVLDSADAEWSTPYSGPELPDGPLGFGATCSDGWITYLAPAPDSSSNTSAMLAVSFDLVQHRWTGVRSLVPGSASSTPIAFPEAPYLLMQQAIAGTWSVFDPEAGSITTLTEQPTETDVVVGASKSAILVFDPSSNSPNLTQKAIQ